MNIEVINGAELNDVLRNIWQGFQSRNPLLRSPYFCHNYVSLVAQIRDDVYISVLRVDERVIGFFPFQRGLAGFGRPVGGVVSDYQGLVTDIDLALDVKWLLRNSGLVRWDFDHLLAEQSAFQAYHQVYASSPIIDLEQGFEAYKAARREAGTKLFEQLARKQRKLEREMGPVRFELCVTDPAVLSTCITWKSLQYRKHGIRDLFSLQWPVELLKQLQQTQSADFSGVLSALWAGDYLIAAHMGMRSRDVCHYWFPSYDPTFSKYSPGQILLLRLAEAAPSIGIKSIDLGKGDSRYKSQLANSAATICGGCVELPSAANRLANFTQKITDWSDRHPSSPWLKRLPGRALARYQNWRRYQ